MTSSIPTSSQGITINNHNNLITYDASEGAGNFVEATTTQGGLNADLNSYLTQTGSITIECEFKWEAGYLFHIGDYVTSSLVCF